jgi:hypothetical protein
LLLAFRKCILGSMKTIFLDLEETIIESVDCPTILSEQIQKIKKFIEPEDNIVVFSFAIWEEKDMTKTLLNIVEEHFGKFSTVFKNALKPLFRKKFGVKDDLDFMDFSNDKQTVFLLWIIEEINSGNLKTDCIFFDDRVTDIFLKVCGKSVEIKNVKNLP